MESDYVDITCALNKLSSDMSKIKNVVDASLVLALQVGVHSFVKYNRLCNFVVYFLLCAVTNFVAKLLVLIWKMTRLIGISFKKENFQIHSKLKIKIKIKK